MVVISDTSPITNLIQIDRLGVLHDLFDKIIIPPLVYQELIRIPGQQTILLATDWIEKRALSDDKTFRQLAVHLDQGEAEAIALCLELNADLLIIDEFKGRQTAENFGLRLTGLLGILLRAKEKGFLAAMRPEMDRLRNLAGFRIHPALYQKILDMAGE